MGFGRRTRTRKISFHNIPKSKGNPGQNELEKLAKISKQGLENTSQREEDRPSAKEQSNLRPIEFSAPPKLSGLEDKLLKRLESGDISLTDKELEIVGNIQSRVNKAPTIKKIEKSIPSKQAKVLQIITNEVKKNIKDSDKKIKSLSAKGLRGKVEQEIKLKEQQLKKLRNLLSKCPTCS